MELLTQAAAKQRQEELSKHFSLGYWYGVNCNKCCDVFPLFDTEGPNAASKGFYVCEVCGRRTKGYEMPWQARDAWNAGETYFDDAQIHFQF